MGTSETRRPFLYSVGGGGGGGVIEETRTLVIQVLVEGGQPVLQLISGVGAELDALGSLRRRVGDGQSAGFLARRLLFNHADAGVL